MTPNVMFHWGVWISQDTPITGAASCNSVEWIYEETDYGDAINLSYDNAWEEFKREKIVEWLALFPDNEEFSPMDKIPTDELIEEWRDEFNNLYEGSGETFLVGQWELDANGQYEPAKECEFAAVVDYDTNVIQVVQSKYVARCALCSPCYPGQGDLDNEGEWWAYDLPIEMYGSNRENTAEQITIAEFLDIISSPDDSERVEE
jgi:hypothetical protein